MVTDDVSDCLSIWNWIFSHKFTFNLLSLGLTNTEIYLCHPANSWICGESFQSSVLEEWTNIWESAGGRIDNDTWNIVIKAIPFLSRMDVVPAKWADFKHDVLTWLVFRNDHSGRSHRRTSSTAGTSGLVLLATEIFCLSVLLVILSSYRSNITGWWLVLW